MKLLLILSVLYAYSARSQHFSLLSNRNVFTDEIVAEHYQSIRWCQEQAAGVFQPSLPFTNLSVITDEKGKTYSLVMQLDAERKLVYVGMQQILCSLWQCGGGPEMNYLSCMKNSLHAENLTEEEIVSCFIKRLNDCQLIRKNQPR
jgi:hypothetical protein